MKNIIIKQLTLKNFKCYESAKFVFDNKTNQVFGETGVGKSTIKDAYLWCLGFDCNFAPKIDDNIVKDIETMVECIIAIDGVDYTLKRTSTQKWKQTQNGPEFNGNNGKFEFDGVGMTATNYTSQLIELFGVRTANELRIICDLNYFNVDNGTKWTWKERRTYLFDLLDINNKVNTLANEERFALLQQDLLKGKDEVDIQKTLNAEKKANNDNIEKNKILIEDKLSKIGEYSKIDFATLRSEKARLEQDVEDLKTQVITATLNYEAQINTLKNNIKANRYEAERYIKNAEDIEKCINNLVDEKPLYTVCPTCNQPLPKEHIEQTQERLKAETQKKKEQALLEAQNLRSKAQELTSQANNQEKELEATESQLRANREQLDKQSEISIQITELKADISTLQDQIALESILNSLKEEVEQLKTNSKTLLNQESNRIAKQQALKEYIEAKIQLTNNEVNKHFENISFKFFKYNNANAENEYQCTCECLLNGIAYNNLSQGQKIIADFNTNNGLQKILGIQCPQFIDNKQDNTFDMISDNQKIELITCKENNINAVFVKDVYSLEDCYIIKKGE